MDDRLPLRFGSASDAYADDALLIEGDAPASGLSAERFEVRAILAGHAPGCACCAPRGEAARALGRLFLARGRGEIALFSGVLAVTRSPAGRAAVEAAVSGDVVASARFRLA